MRSRARAPMSRAVSGVRMWVVLVAAASSATGPSAASRPRLMTTTSWTVWAASASRWLDTSTVRPSPARWPSRSRIQRIPSGSRPLSGSSMISTPGSPSRAAARVSRWRMPREKPPTRRRAASARPTRSSTWASRRRLIPAAVAMIASARWRCGRGGSSRCPAPPRRCGRVRQVAVADAVDGRGPAVRGGQAQQYPQGGGLAGAVGPEEAGDPARPDLEAEVADGGDGTVPLGEVVDVIMGCPFRWEPARPFRR